jgi:hypothetical protein
VAPMAGGHDPFPAVQGGSSIASALVAAVFREH